MLLASVAVPSALVGIPSQRPLAPIVTLIAKDKGANEVISKDKGASEVIAKYKSANEVIPRTVHRSPDICLTAEENPGKPQL